jgi:hypothetical protein
VSLDAAVVDQIVAGVLGQLGRSDAAQLSNVTTEARRHGDEEGARVESPETRAGVAEIAEKVVTAEVLQAAVERARAVLVQAKAIVTPAARDAAKELGVEIRRMERGGSTKVAAAPHGSAPSTNPPTHHSPLTTHLLLIVQNTAAIDHLWEQLRGSWRRDLLGCPDDAAKLATGELSRGGAATVVILAEQTHRAACLANRGEQVKAASVRTVQDVKTVRQQLRANTWCIDPAGLSWFELKRLFDAVGNP